LTLSEIWAQLVANIQETKPSEYIAVVSAIGSVWFSRKASVWTYPVGLVSTIIYIYISYKFHLLGEAAVNFYYTVMSIYGWYIWLKRNERKEKLIHVSFSDKKTIRFQLLFFLAFYIGIYFALSYLKEGFFPGAIPWADAFASATAFTGMWLMARKKVESWYWWIATNIASVPLYFVKGLVLTSILYFILLVFAFWGLASWIKMARENKEVS